MNDITQLYKLINSSIADHEHGLLVFAGAGASIDPPTCFPSSTELAANIVRALCSTHPLVAREADRYILLTKSIRLEVMLDILLDRVGAEIMNCLRGFCRHATPNLVHQSVARLIAKAGRNSVIATTNFDCMFEKALSQEDIHFEQTIALPTGRLTPPASSGVEVMKLHGSAYGKEGTDTFHTLQAAIAQIGRPVQPEFRKRFLDLLRNHNIIVIGYSGRDDFDLRGLWIEAGQGAHGRLVWIRHPSNSDLHRAAKYIPDEVDQIVSAWGASGVAITCHTSKSLCEVAGLNWKECNLKIGSEWFSDFVYDSRIRDRALHGLARLLIHASSMKEAIQDRLEIAKEVDRILEKSRELESQQSVRRKYWAIKDQAFGLLKSPAESRDYLVWATGTFADSVLSPRAGDTMSPLELAVGIRELAWGIKDLTAPGESWKNRPEECQQLVHLFAQSYEIIKVELDASPTSPHLYEQYLHSSRDYAWGLVFIGNVKDASELLIHQVHNIESHPALHATWHAERILDEIAHTERDLARFLTMNSSWVEASEFYLKAASRYKSMARLNEYWDCIGCAAAARDDPVAFEEACEELVRLQAYTAREILIARRGKWQKQRVS